MQKIIKELSAFYQLVVKIFIQGNISNAATVIAYYSLLAIFPIVICIGNILSLLNIKSTIFMPYLQVALPETIYKILAPFIRDFLDTGSSGLASLSGLVTVWTASRGINAAKRSFNFAYGVANQQNAIVARFFSFILTIFFGLLVGNLMLIFSFGQLVLEYLIPMFHLPIKWLHLFTAYKWPLTFMVIFIIISINYYMLPNAKLHWRLVWPGALFATLGWLAVTQVFSVYVNYFTRSLLGYGTLGTFFVLLLWLHLSSWITMLGAVFNAALEYRFYGKIEPKKLEIKKVLKFTKKSMLK